MKDYVIGVWKVSLMQLISKGKSIGAAGLLLTMIVGANGYAATLTSEYYVQSSTTLSVLQGTSVKRSFSTTHAYALAVTDHVSLRGHSAGGNDYALTGELIGANNIVQTTSSFFDGTSDGTYNYAVDFDSATVWRYNLDWSNATQLFSTGEANSTVLGITYDSTDNTL